MKTQELALREAAPRGLARVVDALRGEDGPLTIGVRSFLFARRPEWFTSASIADALDVVDRDRVILVLRTLVEGWQVTNRCRGLATFYRLEGGPAADMLKLLAFHPKGCARAQLEGLWRDVPLEFLAPDFLDTTLEDLLARGRVQQVETHYRVILPIHAEALSYEHWPVLEEG